MLRRRLLITTLVTIALGSVAAADSPLAGSTLTCSATSTVAGCYVERPILTIGPLELTIGVDAQLAYGGNRSGHLAAYAGAAWYAPTWSAWAEVYNPRTRVPTVGRPDWWRVGFTIRY